MKKLKTAATSVAALFIVLTLSSCNNSFSTNPKILDSNNAPYHDLIKNSVNRSYPNQTSPTNLGITSHHLPTAVNFIGQFYDYLYQSNPNRDLFIIIGPDHFEKCQLEANIGDYPYKTSFGKLDIDHETTHSLETILNPDPNCFKNEHSIGAQTDFIKHLFPEAKIVPITLSSSATDQKVEQIADTLLPYLNKATIIVSVDFNHYREATVAKTYDQATEQKILSLDTTDITVDNVDSPPSLKLAITLAQKANLTPELLSKANSHDLGGPQKNTTGYLNVIFK